MKKKKNSLLFPFVLILVALGLMSSCTTVFPTVANETTPFLDRNEFEILGRVVFVIKNADPPEEGIRAHLVDKARELYGSEVDDVVDITISPISKNYMYFAISKFMVEGVAISWK